MQSSWPPTAEERPAALFRNGRNQAVRIPRDFELPGTQVMMRREGDSLVIRPLQSTGLASLLAGWDALDAELDLEPEDCPAQVRDLF